MPTLTLLHTNDLHGRLTAAMAAWLAAERARLAPCLLFDGGDAVAVGNVGFHRAGEPAHELMNQAGYDAGALGNREFHFRPGPQAAKLRRARFPILSANLEQPMGYGGIQASVLLTPAPGLTVRVIGLTVPMVTATMFARHLSPTRFGDPLDAVRRALRGEPAQVTVVLSHLGLQRDRELAAAGLPVDVILGGHSHTALPQGERVGGTWLFQNEPHGASVTRVSLHLEAGRPVAVEGGTAPFPSP